MPNYCDIDLWIDGPNVQACLDAIAGVEDDGEKTVFDFNKVIPYPEHWAKQDKEAGVIRDRICKMSVEERKQWLTHNQFPKDGYNSGGYEWCVENWGTKWNACEPTIVSQTPTEVQMNFQTAWAPCCPVIKKLAKRFPDLRFTMKWYEQGAGFHGELKVQGDNVLVEENLPYDGNRGG